MGKQRAAIYCRISKDKVGAGLGVERQEADCRALAKQLGWAVVEVFTDNDVSAFSGKVRKRYRAMLDAIRDGRVDAVIAWHTDRIHRSPVELEEYITVCSPRDVPTHCVKAGVLDLSTASGQTTARILGAVARGEVQHMSERIRAQKARALASGDYIGGARGFGYVPVPVHDEHGRPVLTSKGKPKMTLALEPAEAAAIRSAVEGVIGGETIYSVTKRWQAEVAPVRGGKWHAQNVTRILTRPRNAGLVEHRGEVLEGVRGAWPEIISEAQHRSVCAILSNPKRSTYSGVRSLKWIGSGLYRCGRCGADMRSATAANRDGTSRRTYRCRAGIHVSISAEPVDRGVMAAVCEHLDEHGAGLLPAADRDATRELHAEANALNSRLAELEDMFGNGEISRAGLARQKERISAKLDDVNQQLAAAQGGSALDGIATAPSPSAAFLAAPVARQRAVVDALVVVTILPGKAGRLPKGMRFDSQRVQVQLRDADETAVPRGA